MKEETVFLKSKKVQLFKSPSLVTLEPINEMYFNVKQKYVENRF